MHILVIEPDRILAQSYKAALEHTGHTVGLAATAQAAIFAADEQTPDLVVLEMQLVSHSGIEFLYEFRSYTEWQTIPVLVQSIVPPGEFAMSWDILKRELGVVGYRYKPRTNLQTLLRAINQFVIVTT